MGGEDKGSVVGDGRKGNRKRKKVEAVEERREGLGGRGER